MLSAIVGINWGDEGKGRMVDLLCKDYDIVVPLSGGQQCRPHGGERRGKFILNLLPSGISQEGKVNVLGRRNGGRY